MIKKLLTIVFGVFFTFCAQAAQMVNVEYIHNLIANRIGVEVPYNPKLHSPKQVANMEYLLTAVDVANEVLNGQSVSAYGAGEYATKQIADIDVAEFAVNELVIDEPFAITTTDTAESFAFILGAAGTFTVDWGDGTVETIERTDTKFIEYRHSYNAPGKYVVRLGGKATEYAYMDVDPIINMLQGLIVDGDMSGLETLVIPSDGITISFVTASDRIAHIEGSLGSVFPTLENGDNPSFLLTFAGAVNWDGIVPERLFGRIYGQPSPLMFTGTFAYSGLKSVPEKLFASLTGKPSYGMNVATFLLTPALEDAIPDNLYANLKGAPERGAFLGTFALSGFKGEIPANLFKGLKGQAKEAAFALTFAGMPYVKGKIPAKLFAGISGRPAAAQYLGTFAGSGIDLIELINGGDLQMVEGAGFTGSIPSALFAGLNGQPAELAFAGTFGANFGLTGSIPEDLFAGVKGAPAPGMFLGTFAACTKLSGEIPGGLFRNIKGAPALGMFGFTFIEDDRLSGIGDGLFAGISGAAELGMFFGTFFSISDLTGPSAKIGDKYLYEIWPGGDHFTYIYSNKLDDYATIPENWGGLGQATFDEPTFAVTTTPDTKVFSFELGALGSFAIYWGDGEVTEIAASDTDTGMKTLTHTYAKAGEYKIEIAGTSYAYLSGGPAISFESNSNVAKIEGTFRELFPLMPFVAGKILPAPSFYRTFYGCYNLKGEIPEDLFPVMDTTGLLGLSENEGLFAQTFYGCTGLTGEIPAGLFANVTGAPVPAMFAQTFYGCTGLTGEIPETLFETIQGAPATDMFWGTFEGCTGLTGGIPAGLFSGISGAPATYMFVRTFANCTGLTGEIPAGLFSGISGTPAAYMFDQTFYGCSGLTGEIPADLFGGIAGSAATDMFYGTFSRCTGLTGPSAQNSGVYLDEIWDASYMQTMYCDDAQLDDWADIPADMKSCGDVSDVDFSDWAFEANVDGTSSMSVKLAAAGTFYVDWGDGVVDVIEKTDTTSMSYSHTYRRMGSFTIKIGGLATAYNTNDSTATFRFGSNSYLTGISGSLGAIFPTLANGSQPSFYGTFDGAYNLHDEISADLFAGISGTPRPYMFYQTFYNCSGLIGEIPAGLFAGISGAPASYMFYQTFYNCSGLSGEIPADLFAGISGTPAYRMFYGAFSGCSGLTGIAGPLFAGIKGTPADSMFQNTFSGCSGLTGEIPAGMFGELSGRPAEYMFQNTFSGCTGLTGIGGALAAGLTGSPQRAAFSGTFYNCTGLTGEIPEDMFGKLSGSLSAYTFQDTFYNCSGLTGPSVRANGEYLYEIWPNATENQVSNMYAGATGLTDNSCAGTVTVPAIWGATACVDEWPLEITTTKRSSFTFYLSAQGKFYVDWGDGFTSVIDRTNTTSNTSYSHSYAKSGVYKVKLAGLATGYNSSYAAIDFYYNSDQVAAVSGSLGAIFPTLANGSQPIFKGTFEYQYSLRSVPEDLFSGITGAPAPYMFQGTFYNTGLTSVPEDLFSSITGAPAMGVFESTFMYCSDLEEVPAGLFRSISGAPAAGMFGQTFAFCTSLEEIPSGLFSSITGAPAEYMFNQTFVDCTGLKKVPAGLFSGISGAPAAYMFNETFYGCTGLTEIPSDMFGELSGVPAEHMFYQTFYGCNGLTGNSAQIDGEYLYEIWPDATEIQIGSMYAGALGLSDNACGAEPQIPAEWGGQLCVDEWPFAFNTTGSYSEIAFNIAAKGTFYVDWGDGTGKVIEKTDASQVTYSHSYPNYAVRTVKLAGLATGYNASDSIPTFSFNSSNAYRVSSMSGSLGAIFPTLADGSQPSFYRSFYNAYNMKTLPATLFEGVTGQPRSYMFYGTFDYCYGLPAIPEGLFAGLKGTPKPYLFSGTFSNCSGLKGAIPEGLFAGISGAPASNMFYQTFNGCTGLTSMPSGDLFGALSGSGASNMFGYMFRNCSNLRGYSAKSGGKYLYEIWPSATTGQVGGAYGAATGLTDYASIPSAWK